MNNKWARFISGAFAEPVIKISNAKEFSILKRLAKANNLFYWKELEKRGYKEVLHILEINDRTNNFYQNSGKGKQFLVEYAVYKGFTFALLHDYDDCRRNEEEWEIIPMSEIIKELNLS